MRYHKTSTSDFTADFVATKVNEIILNLTLNVGFPDFIYLADQFSGLIDSVLADPDIKTITDINVSAFFNADIMAPLKATYDAVFIK